MYRVYKYEITSENVENEYITLPYGAELLSVMNQHESIVLYCLVNPEETRIENRSLILYGTGIDIPSATYEMIKLYNFKFMGTVSMFDGSLIWHIWMK